MVVFAHHFLHVTYQRGGGETWQPLSLHTVSLSDKAKSGAINTEREREKRVYNLVDSSCKHKV